MLPTEDKTTIIYNSSLKIIGDDKYFSKVAVQLNNYINYQHLYITSDDEIKENDWCLCFINNKYQIRQVDRLGHSENIITTIVTSVNLLDCKKIIATTDKLKTGQHTLKDNQGYAPIKGIVTIDEYLPQPSQAFIEKYCELGGIDKVLVEYEENGLRCYKCGKDEEYCIKHLKNCLGYFESKYKLKTDSSNNIITSFIKDNYSKEEVETLLFNYANDNALLSTKSDIKQFNYWIEQNL